MIPLLCVFAFSLGFAKDWIWTKRVQNIIKKKAIYSANFSTIVWSLRFLFIMLIIDHQYIPGIFFLIGSWFGTYYSVKNNE